MQFSDLILSIPTAINVVELCSIQDNIVICKSINNEDSCKFINLLESSICVRSVIYNERAYII